MLENESAASLQRTSRKDNKTRISGKTPGSLNRNDARRRPSLRDSVKRRLNRISLQTMSGDRCSALWPLGPLHSFPGAVR